MKQLWASITNTYNTMPTKATTKNKNKNKN